MSRWVGGFAEWTDGDTAYLSVAFTWLLHKAYSRAIWYRRYSTSYPTPRVP
jgi:hypothetical protein